jgi:methyl-accepting chemotaxis protein
MKIRSKILIANNISFAVIVAVLWWITYSQVRTILTENVYNELEQTTARIVDMVRSSSEISIKTHLRTIAEKNRSLVEKLHSDYESGSSTEEQAFEAARDILLDPEYGRIGDTGYLAGVSTSGVLVIHPKSEGVDASGLEFMKEAMAMKDGYLEYMWKNTGETEERAKAGWLSYFEPWDLMVWASSYKSEFADLVQADDFRELVLGIQLGDTGYAYVMNTTGDVVIHPTMTGENIYDSRDSGGRYFIREICERKNGSIVYPWQNENEAAPREKSASYAYIEETDWIIVTTYYQDELLRPLSRLAFLFLILFAAAVVIVFLVNLWIGNAISKPIKRVALSMAAMVGQTINLSVSVPIETNDELGETVRNFNSLAERVREVVLDVRKGSSSIATVGDQLLTNASEVSSTVEEIGGTIGSFRRQTELLDGEIQNTGAAVDKITGTVRTVTNQIADQSTAVTRSASAVEEMISTVQAMSDTTGERKVLLDELSSQALHSEQDMLTTARAIDDIAESANLIFGMIDIINQVANQTNMLAMNAAIEAAHAGDAGRGFAVVAEQIRTLAETTGVNVAEISGSVKAILEKIQNTKQSSESTGKAFANMRSGIESVADSIAELLNGMNEMSVGGAQILDGVTRMRDTTLVVDESAKSIDSMVGAIRTATDNLSNISQEQVNGIGEISTGISQIQGTTQVLSKLGTENAEAIEVIEKKIVQFQDS